jgi:hypothetical protein
VQEGLPICRYPPGGSGCGLSFGMGMRRRQLGAAHHVLLLVVIKPVLTGLEAGDDVMPRRRRVFRRVLIGRAVTTADVSTLRTPAEMKPPRRRRCQALCTAIATGFCSWIYSGLILLHFNFPFGGCRFIYLFKAPIKSCRCHPFLPLHEPRPLRSAAWFDRWGSPACHRALLRP